jgi:DNA-binding MarR family transcriptional regulator
MKRKAEELYDAIRLIRPIHQLSAHVVTEQLAGRALSMPMRAVLEVLHFGGPQTVPQLGRALWITRQGIQRIVDEAKQLGYVETRANPGHRRSHLIALTQEGNATYRDVHDAELARIDRMAAPLSAEDLEATVRVLAHVVLELQAIAGDDTNQPTTQQT